MNKVPEVLKTIHHDPRTHRHGARDDVSSPSGLDGALDMLRRLLLVEDSAPMRAAVSVILGDRFGTVHEVDDGDQALGRADKVRPDSIVLDINLPGTSGLDLLPKLRKAHPCARIVVLTSHEDDRYRRESFARGADAYVVKGRAAVDLVRAILAAPCGQAPEPPQLALTAAG